MINFIVLELPGYVSLPYRIPELRQLLRIDWVKWLRWFDKNAVLELAAAEHEHIIDQRAARYDVFFTADNAVNVSDNINDSEHTN